jgi:Zn finger protein HypA/HybF involved in hydrogenase expression
MTKISKKDFDFQEENYGGFCTTCKEFTTDDCEPDVEDNLCPDCGEYTVHGLLQAMLLDLIEVLP